MSSPGFGDRKQLGVFGQGRGTWKTPGSVGKPAPLLRSPAQRFGCQPNLPLLQWVWEVATRPVAVQKLSKLGKGWLLLVLLALMLFLVASCAHMRLSEWEIFCLHFVFLPLREPHRNEVLNLQFECFILQCALKTREENLYSYFHLASVQFCWGFGGKAGVIHFNVSCWCATIPQKVYLCWWKQEVTGISGARLFSWPFWGSSTDSKVRSSHTVQVFLERFIRVKLHSICHLLTARSL